MKDSKSWSSVFASDGNRFLSLFDVANDGSIIRRGVVSHKGVALTPKDFVRYYKSFFYYRYESALFIIFNVSIIFPIFFVFFAFALQPLFFISGLPIVVAVSLLLRALPHYLAMKSTKEAPKIVKIDPLGIVNHLKRQFYLEAPESVEPLQVGGGLNLHPMGKVGGAFGFIAWPIFLAVALNINDEKFKGISWLDVRTIVNVALDNLLLLGFSNILFFSGFLILYEYYKKFKLGEFWINGYDPSVIIDNYQKLVEIYQENKKAKNPLPPAYRRMLRLKIGMGIVVWLGLLIALLTV